MIHRIAFAALALATAQSHWRRSMPSPVNDHCMHTHTRHWEPAELRLHIGDDTIQQERL
jgi:hypothetical protein